MKRRRKENKHSILLKFGEQCHMEALFTRGEVFCNTLHSFAQLEDASGRGDIYENVVEILSSSPSSPLHLFIRPLDSSPADFKQINVKAVQFRQSYPLHTPAGNIFCMYGFQITDFTPNKMNPILVDLDELGDTVVLIRNAPEFLDRIDNALIKLNLPFGRDFVKYRNLKTFSGKRDPFLKDNTFAKQQEFRYFVDYPINKSLKLNIGSIEDIASIHSTDKLSGFHYLIAPADKQIG